MNSDVTTVTKTNPILSWNVDTSFEVWKDSMNSCWRLDGRPIDRAAVSCLLRIGTKRSAYYSLFVGSLSATLLALSQIVYVTMHRRKGLSVSGSAYISVLSLSLLLSMPLPLSLPLPLPLPLSMPLPMSVFFSVSVDVSVSFYVSVSASVSFSASVPVSVFLVLSLCLWFCPCLYDCLCLTSVSVSASVFVSFSVSFSVAVSVSVSRSLPPFLFL